MKRLKNFIKGFVILISSIVLLLYVFNVDYLLRAVRTIYLKGYVTAFLEDYKEFPNRTIKRGLHSLGLLLKITTLLPKQLHCIKQIKN